MQRQRQRAAERVLTHGRSVNLVVKARWNQADKLKRYGLTRADFDLLLAAQDNACGMCRKPFEDGARICIDHDHACCPVSPGAQTKCCGKCVRGLLCFRCNTALGYVELYGELARAYTRQVIPLPGASPGRADVAPPAQDEPGVGQRVRAARRAQVAEADTT